MRVYPEQFADHLKAGLKPCYLILGTILFRMSKPSTVHPSPQPGQVLMRIYPEQLADHLKAGLKPCYLILETSPCSLEAIDAVRQVARKQGFDERHSFVVEQGLDWNQVYDACQAMSLFSARQIIELELPAKVDKELAARISGSANSCTPTCCWC